MRNSCLALPSCYLAKQAHLLFHLVSGGFSGCHQKVETCNPNVNKIRHHRLCNFQQGQIGLSSGAAIHQITSRMVYQTKERDGPGELSPSKYLETLIHRKRARSGPELKTSIQTLAVVLNCMKSLVRQATTLM